MSEQPGPAVNPRGEPDRSRTPRGSFGPADTGGAAAGGRGSLLVAAGIFLSRVSGLVRESALAAFLGAGPAVDAFRAALRIPNALQNLLGEGVLSASLIPVYTRLLEEGRDEEAGRLAGGVASLLVLLTATLVVVGVVFARPVTTLVAGGFTGARLELTVVLVRILTPGIGFLVLSAWCLGILNSHRRFFLSYVAPVLWNAAQVVVLVVAGLTAYRGAAGEPFGPRSAGLAVALAWGALAGALLQFAVQVPGVLRVATGLRPSLRLTGPVRRVLRAFAPVAGARGVVQLSATLDVFLASFLVAGAPAVLGYAQILYVLPISLFGMSVAAAELPELSRLAGTDRGALPARLRAGLARVAFFVVPTTAVYLVGGDLIVGALFQRGAFTATQTLQVWVVLGGYALGLLASTASRLYQSALYAVGDTRAPARASIIRVATSAALGVVAMLQLDRLGVTADGVVLLGDLPALAPLPAAIRAGVPEIPRLGALGLTLGAAAGSWVELFLLRRRVRGRLAPVALGGGALRRTALATLAAVAVIVLLRPLTGGLPVLAAAAVVLMLAGVAYLAAATALGLDAVARLRGLRRRP